MVNDKPICRPESALDDMPTCSKDNFASWRPNANLNFSARDRYNNGIPPRYRPRIWRDPNTRSAMVISGGNR